MQFQIPQFIEREARIVGPLTLKQFIYLGIPGMIAFIFYFTAPFMIFLIAAAFLGMIGLALAFMRTGGKSFPELVMNALQFSMKPKTYIWRKDRVVRKAEEKTYAPEPVQEGGIPTKVVLIQESKVQDLATKIETKQQPNG